MMKQVSVAALLVLSFTVRVADASEHLHPRLKTSQVVLTIVALVPTRAEFARVALTGVEDQLEEADLLASRVSLAAVTLLRERGVTVIEGAFVPLMHDDEARYEMADLQTRYDGLSVPMRRKPKDVRKGRFSLGDVIAPLASKADARALLFIRTFGTSSSRAARVFNLDPFRQQIRYELAIVDGNTGDILFFAMKEIATAFGIGKGSDPASQIVRLMRRAIRRIPVARSE